MCVWKRACVGLCAGDCRRGVPLWAGAFDAVGDISVRPGAFDAVGDGGVKRWVNHSWEEGLCLGRVVTGVRVLMWWLMSRIRLSLRCRGVGRLLLLD